MSDSIHYIAEGRRFTQNRHAYCGAHSGATGLKTTFLAHLVTCDACRHKLALERPVRRRAEPEEVTASLAAPIARPITVAPAAAPAQHAPRLSPSSAVVAVGLFACVLGIAWIVEDTQASHLARQAEMKAFIPKLPTACQKFEALTKTQQAAWTRTRPSPCKAGEDVFLLLQGTIPPPSGEAVRPTPTPYVIQADARNGR